MIFAAHPRPARAIRSSPSIAASISSATLTRSRVVEHEPSVLDVNPDGSVDVLAVVADGYRRGLDRGVDETTVEYAIRFTGAAKYYWLAPRMLSWVRQTSGRAYYDTRDPAAMFAGRAPVLERIAVWGRSALSD